MKEETVKQKSSTDKQEMMMESVNLKFLSIELALFNQKLYFATGIACIEYWVQIAFQGKREFCVDVFIIFWFFSQNLWCCTYKEGRT